MSMTSQVAIWVGVFFVLGMGSGAIFCSFYWLWKSERVRADAAEAVARKLGLQHDPSVASPALAVIPESLVPTIVPGRLPFDMAPPDDPSPDGLELDFIVKRLMEEDGVDRETAVAQAEQMLDSYRKQGAHG